MSVRENVSHQVATLAATYRLLLRENDITRANLKSKLIAAQAVMEDGSEINALAFEGGTTQAIVLYPKEVVLAAALQVLEETDPANPLAGANQDVIHADFSRTRIET